MKKIILFSVLLTLSFSIFAQSHFSYEPHQAAITTILPVPNKSSIDFSYFSSGDDGFIVKWGDEGEHYQISDIGIKMMAVSPSGNEIAVYETDGGSINKVSVWDWRTFTRKYYKKYTDSITSLKFSAKGTYLIIGTATVNGVDFVRTQDWSKVSKLKSTTGISNYIHTTDTEKTVVFYSPSGNLSYFNMITGELKDKISIAQALSQTVMFNSNKYFAGVKDNNIYVYNAFRGNLIKTVAAKNPIILSTPSDAELYYLEYDGKNNYELKMMEPQENLTISTPRSVKTLRGPRGNDAITTGIKHHSEIVLGGGNGSIYKIDNDPSLTTTAMAEISKNEYSKIYDMAPVSSDFFFLTDKSIYRSSYDTGVVDKQVASNGETNLITYDENNVILWTTGSRNSVKMKNIQTKEEAVLFTPRNNMQTLKLSSIGEKKYLVEIEKNTNISLYDFTNKTFKQVYSGTGIQDATLADNGNLYIAKSAASNPQVPLLAMNIETLETVPCELNGNVSYGLSTDGKMIYGVVLVSNENTQNTFIFSYNTQTKKAANLLKFAEEDSGAFTYLYNNVLYTNIGRNKVYCYNMGTKKRFSYNRSASIPESICQNGNRVVILNQNGSISWCTPTQSALTADWYLTNDEQWYEF